MATKPDKLTPAQLAAIDSLATGASVTAAAQVANVTRQTASEWLNQHSEFQAALNCRRAELWNETADRLRALMPRALERTESAIDGDSPGGLEASLALLRFSKIELTPRGGTDAEEIEIEKSWRARELLLRSVAAG